MFLKDLLSEIRKNLKTKDILEYNNINILQNFKDESYYIKKIEELPKDEYFITDMDWTFFRWMLSKETFSLFIKYIKKQNILDLNKELFKEFIDDIHFFYEIEKKAYNKEIDYFEYNDVWMFLLFKYTTLVDFKEFLLFLKNSFSYKNKVNPYRFSIEKIKEALKKWKKVLFISWAPSFTLDIYLDLLTEYLWVWKNSIYWIWTYINIEKKYRILMFWKEHKYELIKYLKENKIIKNIYWGMWDSSSDYWIALHMEDKKNFYFVNPDKWVFESEFVSDEYNFIFERKNLIFSIKKDDIKIIS